MSDREMSVPMTAVPIGERLWVVPVEVAEYIKKLEAQLAAPASEPVSHAARANVASQCLATASSDFAANVLVDADNGTLRELLQDAAAAILAAPQGE